MTGWHFVKTECRYGGRSEILPWYYLEQQEAHICIAHTWEKVTEKNGEQRQIASPSHYWSWLPQYVAQSATLQGRRGKWASDSGQELWRCYINLVFVCATLPLSTNSSFLPPQGNHGRVILLLILQILNIKVQLSSRNCGFVMLKATCMNLSKETLKLFCVLQISNRVWS